MRPTLLAGALLALIVGLPGAARAGSWTYTEPGSASRAEARWHYSARAGVWIGTYDRPQRACDPNRLIQDVGGGGVIAQFPPFGGFCPHDASDEVAVTAGIDVAFRLFAPLYVTVGLDLAYTDPSAQILRNQVIAALPMSVLITWYDWLVRPILQAQIIPMVFLTDVNRDFTMGFSGGLAVRLGGAGDLAFTVGRGWSESLDFWQAQLAFHPF